MDSVKHSLASHLWLTRCHERLRNASLAATCLAAWTRAHAAEQQRSAALAFAETEPSTLLRAAFVQWRLAARLQAQPEQIEPAEGPAGSHWPSFRWPALAEVPCEKAWHGLS